MKVFSNLAISLDGKIADSSYPKKALGTPLDRKIMKDIRSQADVLLVGAKTLRVMGAAVKQKNKKGRFLVNALITKSGIIDSTLSFWSDPKIIRYVFCPKQSYAKAVESAQDRAFVVAAGEQSVDPRIVIETLKVAGFRNLLVEGGGEIFRLFVESRLLQEAYLTLCPHLIGGEESPGLLAGRDALSPWASMRLLKAKKVKNELFLHYRFLNALKG